MIPERCKKSSLNTVSIASQALVVNDFIEFDTNTVLTGCSISHTPGSNTIQITKPGLYSIDFDTTILGTVAGVVSFQILNNGVAIQGAAGASTVAVGGVENIAINTLLVVPPSCCAVDNTANLQVQIQTTAATVNVAGIRVVKEA